MNELSDDKFIEIATVLLVRRHFNFTNQRKKKFLITVIRCGRRFINLYFFFRKEFESKVFLIIFF